MFVKKSCKTRDRTIVVPRCMAGRLKVWLRMPHINSEIGVEGEHTLVLARLHALQGKFQGQIGSSLVESLLLQGYQAEMWPKVAK